MRRHAFRLTLAAVIGVIALPSAAAVAARGSTGAAGSLTQQFPLGTQTLCCQSHSSTTPSRTSTTTPQRASTTARHSGATPAVRKPGSNGGFSGLVLLAAIPALIVVALLTRRLYRRSRRRSPRDRRELTDRGVSWSYEGDREREPPPLPIRPRHK
jgi:hypothetical protein